MSESTEVVRSGDPREGDLVADGYQLVGVSWGAHLSVDGESHVLRLRDVASQVIAGGFSLTELEPRWADDVHGVETATNDDYPATPATFHAPRTRVDVEALWGPGRWVFGALDNGTLVGVCAMSDRGGKVEIDFGSVVRAYRGRRLGAGVVAHGILELDRLGHHRFATGGAEVNAASRALVKSLGFEVDETWHSYLKP